MIKIAVKLKSEILMEYIPAPGKTRIGRIKGNNIVLDDEAVSDEHCVINCTPEGVCSVEDLNTAFGTFVNGNRVTKQEMKQGDQIGIGNHALIIKSASKSRDKSSEGQESLYLLGIQGPMYGRKFEINSLETRIGRSEEFNDVWISKDVDKSVSRRHATIKFADGKYSLTDRRSRNRTFVNQRQVKETDEVILKDRDEILVGKSIFRFVIGEVDDYSLPAKAGIFWIRILPKLALVISAILVVSSVGMIFTGIKGNMVMSSKPSEIFLERSDWAAEELSDNWMDYLKEGDFDITPSPAVGDIDSDGNAEIVMSDAAGRVIAWSSKDGRMLWKMEIGQRMLTSPSLADVNTDGILDVVVGSDNSRLYVLDGASGQMLYKSSFIGGKLLFASSPLVHDLDGDGFKDIVVTTDDKVVCFLYSPITGGKKPYYFKTPESVMSSPVLVRRVDDSDKVAIATTGGKIYFFDVMNPERREVVDVTQKINMLKGVNLVLNEITTVPAASDIDGDGNDDLVFATGAYYVAALNTVSQTIMWAYKIMPFSTLATPARYSSPVLTDLDNDGTPDVIIGWANGKIIALNGNNGETIWEYYTSRENRIISSIALADINKDGVMDPVIAGEDGSVFVLDGAPDANQRLMSNRVSTKGPVTSTPCIGDIDGDGMVEIVVTSVKNQLYVFDAPTKVFKREIFWESFRKDAKNSGALFYVSMGMKFNALIGAGILLILGVLLNIKYSKKKKLAKLPPVIVGKKK